LQPFDFFFVPFWLVEEFGENLHGDASARFSWYGRGQIEFVGYQSLVREDGKLEPQVPPHPMRLPHFEGNNNTREVRTGYLQPSLEREELIAPQSLPRGCGWFFIERRGAPIKLAE